MFRNNSIKQSYSNEYSPLGKRHEIITIPSSSAPIFGSNVILDFKEKNIEIHELMLQFNTSAITGMSGSDTQFPNLSPAYFWFSRLEILINNVVIDTLYGDEQFIKNQLYFNDEDRRMNNLSSGNYASRTQRRTLASLNNQNYFVPLKTIFQQTHFASITNGHEIQVRLVLNPLSSIVNAGAFTGTPIVLINQLNLVAKITRLDGYEAGEKMSRLTKPKYHSWLETRQAPFTLQSGITTTSLVLSSVVGRVSNMFFVVRNPALITRDDNFNFTPILSFSILGSSGDNIVGGSPLPSSLNMLVQGKWWTQSSYLCDSFEGVSNAFVYQYCFSYDPLSTQDTGDSSGFRTFQGNEVLQITFPAATATALQVDAYFYIENMLEQNLNSVRKITVV